MIVCVSANALSRSSSLGRIVASFRFGILLGQALLDEGDPLVLVRGAQRAGDDRELAACRSAGARLRRSARCAMPSGVAWLTKKSRASGSASASQVSTLMPRSRALRSTRRDPAAVLDRDGNRVDLAGDPVLDQLVLPRGVEAGRSVPDQLDAELLRRLLRAGAAADEVRIAFRLRHHRDHRPPLRRRRRRRRAARRGRRGARRPQRPDQPHVGARRRAARRRRSWRRGRQPDCSSLLPPDETAAERAGARSRSRSSAIVARSSPPVSTPASSDGSAASCRPLRSTEMAKSPSSVPQSVPRPPKTDVPPSTTAVMASSS